MDNDTIDWLDLDYWPEKDTQKPADMDNTFAWLAQQGQPLSGQPLPGSQYPVHPQMVQPQDGLIFHDTFHPQSTAGSLLSELSGVSMLPPIGCLPPACQLAQVSKLKQDHLPMQDLLDPATVDIPTVQYEAGLRQSQHQQTGMQLRSDTAQNGASPSLTDMVQGPAFGRSSSSLSQQAGAAVSTACYTSYPSESQTCYCPLNFIHSQTFSAFKPQLCMIKQFRL